MPRRLFVHNVQITESAQGRMHGYRIYQWLLKSAALADIQEIVCEAFIDSSVIPLYERLGFTRGSALKQLRRILHFVRCGQKLKASLNP
ncbi:hypothetical protein [Congregibacter brevis]|uniref:hypothetical protein n=1 Tax=Congregibacter brevis TaxID=3081201 RepID=UPI003890A441